MKLTQKKIKQRYFDKVYNNAPMIKCQCGCGEWIKSKDKYGRDKKYISGHNGRKYSDPTQYKREWNMRNKSKRTKYRRESRQKRKGILILYKGSTCKNCGYAYDGKNGCAFDFHHLREKSFGVSGNVMEKSIETLKKEADKCELMCAICHRREHSDEY